MQPWYSTAISSNGDVYICDPHKWYQEAKDFIIGNINDKPLSEIWKSEKFQNFRNSHLKMDIDHLPVCGNCDLWASYTNIWSRTPESSFKYNRPRLLELFQRTERPRGG